MRISFNYSMYIKPTTTCTLSPSIAKKEIYVNLLKKREK